MMEIAEDCKGKKLLSLGNEAIARGGLEAGVNIVTAYPGTPSSEIADTFSKLSQHKIKQNQNPGFYFEYSINEKVALEISAAASLCDLRTLTCMKHVGLNVASDALMTYLYVGSKGGHIIVSADDPNCHSSQNEQDNRYYALFGNIPMLEPSTPQEAKEMTRIGFDISENIRLPILLRITTRVSHAKGPIILKKLQVPKDKGIFEKDFSLSYESVSSKIKHKILLRKMEKAEKISEKSLFNTIITIGKPKDIGIVTSGVSFNYVKEIVNEMNLDVKILKLGMTHPIPKYLCTKFLKSCKIIIVVEELEPILENQFKFLAYENNSNVKIFGKSTGHFSRLYEYSPDIVTDAFSKIFKVKNPLSSSKNKKLKLPNRQATLCPGCPHRATYYAVKQAAPKNTIYPNDIGCYILGKAPPLQMADILICMGANAGIACGFSIFSDQKIVSFMGDSTFFHSGIPPIIDAVHHNHNVVITILDNQTTAMTGHQPHPGSKLDGMGRQSNFINIADVIRGLGIKHLEIVNPNNISDTTDAFKRALNFQGPSVIVSKSPCIQLELKRKKVSGKDKFVYFIDQVVCNQCKTCINQFGCPAFYYTEKGNVKINEEQCNGCGNCVEICPINAILKMESNKWLTEKTS